MNKLEKKYLFYAVHIKVERRFSESQRSLDISSLNHISIYYFFKKNFLKSVHFSNILKLLYP